MDFGVLAPEINSGRIYAGPGSGPMLAAATAWDLLAVQLRWTAASYSSLISGLTVGWRGPSSAAMGAAAAPYATWMSATAAQAEETAVQARAAAAAYATAFAATVPPPVVAANRAELASLVATNIFGQNAAPIAATEAEYADMWAQDAAAMYGYASASATASRVTPFTPPPQTTNPAGRAAQSATVAQAMGTWADTSAQSMLSQLMSGVPSSLQGLAAPAAVDPPSLQSLLNTFLPVEIALEAFEGTGSASLPSRNALASSTIGFGLAARGFKTGELAVPLTPGVLYPPVADLAEAGPAVSVAAGNAGLVGRLSVPPSWTAATPAIRLAATVLQGAGPAAASLVAASSEGGLLGQMALASLAVSSLRGALLSVGSGTDVRKGRSDSGSDKDNQTSEKLKRVLSELSQKPESVQHWHTDKTHLETLLERLSNKPGIHAVHVSSRDKPDPTPRWG